MSAGIHVDLFGDAGWEITGKCSVVSIYEDLGGRDLLLRLCDSLAWQFKRDLEFRVDWCRFKYLADPEIAMEAAQMAAQAELILLAPQSSELPVYVQGWFKGWAANREAGEGALVLVQPSPKEVSQSFSMRSDLRQIAKRAHLDYLRLSSSAMVEVFPLSQNELNNLLADDDRPMHWGINE